VGKVIVVPTWLNPFKSSFHASPQKRLEWCRRVFEPEGAVVEPCEIEKRRAVYTIETVRELEKSYEIKGIVIGSDNLPSIKRWKEFEKLDDTLTWCVVSRNGGKMDLSILKNAVGIHLDIPVSSSDIREGKKWEYLPESIADEAMAIYNKI